MSSMHRKIEKNFETEMRIDNVRLPLNHFVQETIANMMLGLVKTLKDVSAEVPASIDIKIRRLPEKLEVDAHTYP